MLNMEDKNYKIRDYGYGSYINFSSETFEAQMKKYMHELVKALDQTNCATYFTFEQARNFFNADSFERQLISTRCQTIALKMLIEENEKYIEALETQVGKQNDGHGNK
jgi:hypothetical protein